MVLGGPAFLMELWLTQFLPSVILRTCADLNAGPKNQYQGLLYYLFVYLFACLFINVHWTNSIQKIMGKAPADKRWHLYLYISGKKEINDTVMHRQ